MDKADIFNRFTYHAPDGEKAKKHEQLRRAIHSLALEVNALVPEGREKSLAITHLEEVMFWANAALARS